MACETQTRKNQTLSERKEEIRQTVAEIIGKLISGEITPKVGPQGGIAFNGLSDKDRNGVTDVCAYRMIMMGNSTLAKMKIQQAEMLSGRSVASSALAQGIHSHDGGKTWHKGH